MSPKQINNINPFDGDYNSSTNLPTINNSSGDYNDLTNRPTLLVVIMTTFINKPTIFSGNYNDLVNQTIIPSLTGYATETYVNTQISNIVDSAIRHLHCLGRT